MKIKTLANARNYDCNGYRLRAGCICFKDDTEKEVLLVTSSRDANIWVVPAGGIEKGEECQVAAEREVREEAGAQGDVKTFIGVFRDERKKTLTYMYSMVVKKLVKPIDQKDRKWFKITDALVKLGHRPSQQSYITKTLNKLSTVDGPNLGISSISTALVR